MWLQGREALLPSSLGYSVVRNPSDDAGDIGLIPSLGRCDMLWSNKACAAQLLSLCSGAWEPQLLDPCAATTEACCPRGCGSESHSVLSDSLQPHGLYSPWNSPGQNTGVDRHSLLQEIFPTQGLNPGLQQSRRILYQLSQQGSPCALEERIASTHGN